VGTVDLVQADVPDVLPVDLDREDLFIRLASVFAEPSFFLRERHPGSPAEEVGHLGIAEPPHAPTQVPLREGAEDDARALDDPVRVDHDEAHPPDS